MRHPLIPVALVLAVGLSALWWLLGETGAPGEGPDAWDDTVRAAARADAPLSPATEYAVEYAVATTSGGAGANEAVRLAGIATGRLEVRIAERGTGRPVPDIGLCLSSPDPSASAGILANARAVIDAYTDADGRAVLLAPPLVELRLLVRSVDPGAGNELIHVPALTPGEVRQVAVELQLRPDIEFWGRVEDEDGRPIADARVDLYQGGGSNSASGRSAPKHLARELFTDSRGLFQLAQASWTGAYVLVTSPGFGPLMAGITIGHETSADASVMRLARSATLAATILGDTGSVIEATVRLSTSSRWLSPSGAAAIVGNDPEWSAMTAPDGTCEFPDLPPRAPISVEVRVRDALMLTVGPLTFEPGERREATWTIGRGTRLHGVLLSEAGAPLPDREVWLARATGMSADAAERRCFHPVDAARLEARRSTGADGRFEFPGVAAGRWWLGPAPPSPRIEAAVESVYPEAQLVEVPADRDELEVVLATRAGLFLEGRTFDPDGEPLAHALIEVRQEDGGEGARDRSLVDGTFSAGPLLPGMYRIRASAWSGSLASEWVSARAGERELALRLASAGGIRGRVIDASGTASASARVSVWRRERGRSKAEDVVWSGPGGAFQVDGMHDGRYDLTAHTDDGRVAVSRGIEVRPGVRVDGIVLTLEPAALLVVGYEGHAASATVEVLLDGEVLAAGGVTRGTRAKFWVLPGPVRVRLFVDGQEVEHRDAQTTLESRSEVLFE